MLKDVDMTIIVTTVDKKVITMTGDGRGSLRQMVVSDHCVKVHRHHDRLYGFAGSTQEIDQALKVLPFIPDGAAPETVEMFLSRILQDSTCITAAWVNDKPRLDRFGHGKAHRITDRVDFLGSGSRMGIDLFTPTRLLHDCTAAEAAVITVNTVGLIHSSCGGSTTTVRVAREVAK